MELGLWRQQSQGTILFFWTHFNQSLADVEQMGHVKEQTQSFPYSSELAQEQLQFLKAFWQKKSWSITISSFNSLVP